MSVRVLVLLVGALPALADPSGPEFAARQQAALLARAGEAAALRCRVLRLGDRAVSWVRSSDLQILTHAGAVFTADSRVSCSEAPDDRPDAPDAPDAPDTGELPYGDVLTSRDGGRAGAGSVHTLRVERLRAADSGRYECQINTEPKMSLFFNLTVVERAVPEVAVPEVAVRALGPAEVRASPGGAARLACEARYEARGAPLAEAALGALPALRLRWLHDGEPLDPEGPRGGVSLRTERRAGRLAARLALRGLRAPDAGRYTCAAEGGGARGAAHLLLRLGPPEPPDAPGPPAEGGLEAMQRDQAAPGAAHAPRPRAGAVLLLTMLPLLPLR